MKGIPYSVWLQCEKHCADWRVDDTLTFDPNNPPAEWGPPLSLTLVPSERDLPRLNVAIPGEATPVFHKYGVGPLTGRRRVTAVRIGFRLNGRRHMKSIDLNSGEVENIIDEG